MLKKIKRTNRSPKPNQSPKPNRSPKPNPKLKKNPNPNPDAEQKEGGIALLSRGVVSESRRKNQNVIPGNLATQNVQVEKNVKRCQKIETKIAAQKSAM